MARAAVAGQPPPAFDRRIRAGGEVGADNDPMHSAHGETLPKQKTRHAIYDRPVDKACAAMSRTPCSFELGALCGLRFVNQADATRAVGIGGQRDGFEGAVDPGHQAVTRKRYVGD